MSVLGQVVSIGLEGMKGHSVIVEANVRDDKDACVIVGLPDGAMKESKERILSCLHELDVDVSMKKITIHLSPADKRKTGTGHDCAMLIAVLQKIMSDPIKVEKDTCFLAALSLTGNLMPFHGLIPAIQQAILLGFKQIIIPPIDLHFLDEVNKEKLVPIHSLAHLLDYLQGQRTFLLHEEPIIHLQEETTTNLTVTSTDFQDIRGHREAKRVLEIAAAGGHHVLLSGPPGCGKTILADAYHTILPKLHNEEMLEVFGIYHLAKENRGFSNRPPYRNPHHSASAVSLIGGGTFPKPGEISLSHKGVLFLDELGEFSRKALDMLRQPMESGEVTISRVRQTVTYPSSFSLIAATNPCPCGYYGSNERYCTCTPQQVRTYQLKASGPLLDRMDFILNLKSIGLSDKTVAESSTTIRTRVEQARAVQRKRYNKQGLNGTVPFVEINRYCLLTEKQREWLQGVCFKEKWSNRTQAKLIRIARTIADLANDTMITDKSLKEAVKWKSIASEIQTTNEGTLHG